MKTIEVPVTVELKSFNSRGGEDDIKPISFKEYVQFHLDLHATGKVTGKMSRQMNKIHDIIEKSNGTLTLEDADYDLVKDACGDWKYVAGIARQLTSYLDAVEAATDSGKAPTEKK